MTRQISIGLLCLLVSGCAKKEAEATKEEVEEPRPVQVEGVAKGSIQNIIAVDGVLRALDQSAVTAKISAPVKRFLVNKGDHVRAGQLIAVLESADLSAFVADAKGAYDQTVAALRTVSASSVVEEMGKAQSDVDAARQTLDAAQKLVDSRQQMFREGALARRLVDEASVAQAQAKSQYDTAQKHLESFSNVARQESINAAAGQRDSAKGKLDAAQVQLSYAEVHSPIAGVVAERPVFAGEMATVGTPLMTIMDVSRVIARVNVPQSQAKNVQIGQSARVVATDGSAEVDGKITVISPSVDPQSTTVEVWVEAPNPGEKLRPGGTVHVAIVAGTIQNAILVPPSALYQYKEGGSAVLVVGPDSKAHAHKVEVGVRGADKVQIIPAKGDDIGPGTAIVIEGGLGLDDGAKVKIEVPENGDEDDEDNADEAKGKGATDSKDAKAGGKK
ncbi:MAG: efflux RND transporter periplasmic adaptor subunit [Acidobacteriota bacterium]